MDWKQGNNANKINIRHVNTQISDMGLIIKQLFAKRKKSNLKIE